MKPVSMISTLMAVPRRHVTSRPAATAAISSAPDNVPRSWAAAIAAGTDDTPACRMAPSCVSS